MTSGDPASPDALVAQPMARSGQPVVKIATGPAGGARDALDGGADVLITDDAATLDYARSATGYVDVPLEWSRDRKSTRLNSSHGYISYAVFCLKKKKKNKKETDYEK